MVSEKQQILKSAYYLISMDTKKLNRKSLGYIGKLRSNFSNTEFNLFGEGENPNKKLKPEYIRKQHAGILYNTSDLISIASDEIMNVFIPKVLNSTKFYEWKPMKVRFT